MGHWSERANKDISNDLNFYQQFFKVSDFLIL